MPYVQRGADGNINGLFANPQDWANEFLPDDDAQVVAFLAPAPDVVKSDPVAESVQVADNSTRLDDLEARMADVEAKLGIAPASPAIPS